MRLQLTKIKKQNAFDYSLLSEFMKKKNGKLIFTAGFGNAGKIRDNAQKVKLNLMQKFERNFQFQSIIKSYNEVFHIHPKKSENNLFPENIPIINNAINLPNITKNVKKLKEKKSNPKSTSNNFYRKKIHLKSSSLTFKPNSSIYGKNITFLNKNDDNVNDEDKSIDYNDYFYHTIDFIHQGNNSYSEKDFNITLNKASSETNYINNLKNNIKNKKLYKNISQDCIYLFGQNKIIFKNKNEKSRNEMNIEQKSEIQKNPFIDYNKEFNPYKTKMKLKKNFEFYRDKTKIFENFFEGKQEHIFKIRKMFENKKNIKYKYEYLPSHKSVNIIVRKKKNLE